MQTSGDQRREIAKLYRRHCERSEAIHLTTCRAMDCFAALAMTGERAGFAPRNDGENCSSSSYPAKAGDPVRRGLSVQSSTPLEYWVTRLRG